MEPEVLLGQSGQQGKGDRELGSPASGPLTQSSGCRRVWRLGSPLDRTLPGRGAGSLESCLLHAGGDGQGSFLLDPLNTSRRGRRGQREDQLLLCLLKALGEGQWCH